MPQEGFLLISDITGYTVYLNESELEHAQSSLTDLLKLLLDHTRSPLVFSKLEGDAVFSYAPAGGFKGGQTLLEMVEVTYAAFRKALDLMVINTTCTCNACRNLPNLDLKFFVHYGAFSEQQIGDYRELVGNDVNLVHRLVKNRVVEQTGLTAYAAYTGAVVDALEMGSLVADMPSHHERYDDVGQVPLFIQDMHGVWDRRKDELRVVVDPQDALYVVNQDYSVPPPLLWEYITRPEYRLILSGSDNQSLSGLTDGRIGEGAVYVCAHGDNKSVHTVLDWQPFEQYTTQETWPIPGLLGRVTYRLSPTEDGARMQMIIGRASGPWYRGYFNLFARYFVLPKISQSAAALHARIKADLAASPPPEAHRVILGDQQVSAAAASSLTVNAGEPN